MPNVGKSTIFQTITKKQVNIANYPFCTIDPNVGVVAVPDDRVDKLAELEKSAKKIYTTIEFVDIAGLVKNANKGEGLGNKFLANIRETDAIIYLLRGFLKSDVINVENIVDPLGEKAILDTELSLKDLETIEKRLGGLESEKRAGKPEAAREYDVLIKAKKILEEGKILSEQAFTEEESEALKLYQFLTMKKRLYLINAKDEEVKPEVIETMNKNNWPYLIVDVMTEFQAADLNKEERISLGLPAETEMDIVIRKAYEILDLISFFTTGPDETRAWTLRRGMQAPDAGGAIHSDFKTNFIRADVIHVDDLLKVGGYAKAREKGLIRTEGKEYVVKDGDAIEIKHNA